MKTAHPWMAAIVVAAGLRLDGRAAEPGKAPLRPAAEEKAKSQAPSPEEAARRLGAARECLDQALDQGDRQAILAAVAGMGALGEAAFEPFAEAWSRIHALCRDPKRCDAIQKDGKPGVPDPALTGAFGDDFLEWAIAHDACGKYRASAVYALWRRAPDKFGKAVSAEILLREKDLSAYIALLDSLAVSKDPASAGKILEAAKGHPDPGLRRTAVTYVGRIDSDAARDLLKDLALNDPDPEVQKAAQNPRGR